MKHRWCIVLVLALTMVCGADSSIRSSIQAAYNRANQAMKVKYLDGVLSIRDAAYEVIGPNGKKLSSKDDLKSLQAALSTASEVSETTTIMKFAQLSDSSARARIHDIILLKLPSMPDHPRPPYMIETLSDDDWILTAHQWKLRSTHLLAQRQGYLGNPPVINP